MNRSMWLQVLAMVVVSCAVGVSAVHAKDAGADGTDKAAKEAKAPKSAITGYYAMMASELKLTDEQKQKLEQIINEANAANKQWADAHGARAKEVGNKLKELGKDGDKAEIDKLKAEMGELNSAKAKITEARDSKINDLLTPSQREGKASMDMYAGVSRSLSKAALTEDQKAKIKSMCDEAAKKIAAMPDTDPKASRAVSGQLRQDVIDKVLTDDQKAIVVPVKK